MRKECFGSLPFSALGIFLFIHMKGYYNIIMENNRTYQTRKLITLALLSAIAYAISFISFPIFPAAGYLKLDFGNVFIMLAGFLYGPIEGIAVCLIKELFACLNSTTACTGEIANFIMTSSFIIVPSIMYKYRKGIKSVIISFAIACAIGTAVALPTNRFIVFPLYMKSMAEKMFNDAFWFVLGFNLIKTASISIVTVLMYKRLSTFLKKINAK